MSPHLRVVNDFILIISSILQSINFIFPRVSANVIIEETFFFRGQTEKVWCFGDVETDVKNPCIAKYVVLVENKRLSIAKLQDHQR